MTFWAPGQIRDVATHEKDTHNNNKHAYITTNKHAHNQ